MVLTKTFLRSWIVFSILWVEVQGEDFVHFSTSRGYYDEPFDLVVQPVGEGVVVVTQDASWPTSHNGIKGTLDSPVRIRVGRSMVIRAAILKGENVSGLQTHTYLFREQALEQTRPVNVSEKIDFVMSPPSSDCPWHPSEIREIFLMAPTVSLSMPYSDLFGSDGIYLNSKSKGPDWERKASVEWIDVKSRTFTGVHCQVEIQGGGSRLHSVKQNFELQFKRPFGPEKFRLPIFEETQVESFNSLVLKNPTHDSWVVNHQEWLENARYVNDQWSAETQRAMGHSAPSHRWVHLFLNGYYWGIYAILERPDASFSASHFGGKKGQYDAFNAGRLRSGDRQRLEELYRLVSGEGINEKETYQRIEKFLDLDNLIDFILLNIYSANKDWPHKNYWLVGHRSNRPQFRFLSWDAEIGFFEAREGKQGEEVVSALRFNGFEASRFKKDSGGAGYFYRHLARNPEFQLRFLDRAFFHCQEGALSPKKSAKRYRRLLNEIRPLLDLESLRWGDSRRDRVFKPWGDEWEKKNGADSWLFTDFFPKRSNELIGYLAKGNLNPPVITRTPDNANEVVMKNPNSHGKVIFTRNGTDPREYWSGEVVGEVYHEAIRLRDGDLIKARVLSEKKWSPVCSFKRGKNLDQD